MRALVLKGSGDLRVEDVPDPVPGPGKVLIRVLATGICGSDVHGYTGESGRRLPGQIMGHETVGRRVPNGELVTVNPVISCGHCEACIAGDNQACPTRKIIGVNPEINSAFAELMVVPEANVVPLSEDLRPEYGTLVEPLSVGQHAVNRGGCTEADRVLVIGGGPIGQACVLAARRRGAVVAMSEPDLGRRELGARLGAHPLAPGGDIKATSTEVLGGPVTLVLDAVGTSSTVATALHSSSLKARVVLVGMHEPTITLPAYAVSTGERSVIGSFVYNAAEFAEVAAWVSTSPTVLSLLVERVVELDEGPREFAQAANGNLGVGKVIVRCSTDSVDT